jgi:hypothetical protein
MTLIMLLAIPTTRVQSGQSLLGGNMVIEKIRPGHFHSMATEREDKKRE